MSSDIHGARYATTRHDGKGFDGARLDTLFLAIPVFVEGDPGAVLLEGRRVVLFLSGISVVNAAMTVQLALDHFAIERILFSGIAGGVDPGLNIGDVVIADRWGQYLEMFFVAGPRHTMVLSADAKTIETVGFLVEKGLAESTGLVGRVGGEGSLCVRLTGKGWMTFRGVAGVREKP